MFYCLRCAAAQDPHRIDVSKHQPVCRHLLQHRLHIHRVPEAVSVCRDICDVPKKGLHHAAVVIDHHKPCLLCRLADPFHIRHRELSEKPRREKSGCRFCHDNAVGSCLLKSSGVIAEKSCHLLQHRLHHLRLLVAEDHDLCHVQKPSGQGVRADHACKYRPVLCHFCNLPDAFQALPGPACPHFRHLQCLRLFFLLDDGCRHGRYLLAAVAHRTSESLRLHGQVHQPQHGCHVKSVRNRLHALRLQLAAPYCLLHRVSRDLDAREGKHRKRPFPALADHILHPSCPVKIHLCFPLLFFFITIYILSARCYDLHVCYGRKNVISGKRREDFHCSTSQRNFSSPGPSTERWD